MATVNDQIRSMDAGAADAIDKYISELRAEAQGDYDFIVKFLKKQHEIALGTDDQARASFFEKVADGLEQRIGRIPFDYEQKTGREKADIANYLRRLEIEKQDANNRETEFNAIQDFKGAEEDRLTKNTFNARGFLGSGLEQKERNRLALARRLTEQDPFNRQMALERARRTEQEGEAVLQSGRRLEDITTDARRAGIDENLAYEKGSEGAKLELNKRIGAIEREGAAERRRTLAALTQEQLFKDSFGG